MRGLRFVRLTCLIASLCLLEVAWQVDRNAKFGVEVLRQAHAQGLEVRAFPTAEGFGAYARGGRGGRVIEVTNLENSGSGSFRDCVETEGPRTCIFRVGGTIHLKRDIGITYPYLTIAGQTAPGGIQLRGLGVGIRIFGGAHNIIIRHLRIRPGAPAEDLNGGNNLVIAGDEEVVHDIIIDHCSLQWGNDEMASTWNAVVGITWQWCIFAEGSPIAPGNSFGYLTGGEQSDIQTISMHHNLFAHNSARNPKFSRAKVVDFRNNIIYNWGGLAPPDYRGPFAIELGQTSDYDHSVKGNLVNNVFIPGPNSITNYFLLLANGGLERERGGTKIYTLGNWGPNCPTGCVEDWENGFADVDEWIKGEELGWASRTKYRADVPFDVPLVMTAPTEEVQALVLSNVGASSPRDEVDERIVNDVLNGTGNIANIGGGGPWPILGGLLPYPDRDRDGIDDRWEARYGLNPFDPTDGAQPSSNGYTNLENFLNQMAGDPVPPFTTDNSQLGEP